MSNKKRSADALEAQLNESADDGALTLRDRMKQARREAEAERAQRAEEHAANAESARARVVERIRSYITERRDRIERYLLDMARYSTTKRIEMFSLLLPRVLSPNLFCHVKLLLDDNRTFIHFSEEEHETLRALITEKADVIPALVVDIGSVFNDLFPNTFSIDRMGKNFFVYVDLK